MIWAVATWRVLKRCQPRVARVAPASAAAVRIQGERRTRASTARRGSKGREKPEEAGVGAGEEGEEDEDDGAEEDEDAEGATAGGGALLRLRWMALMLKSWSAAVMMVL